MVNIIKILLLSGATPPRIRANGNFYKKDAGALPGGMEVVRAFYEGGTSHGELSYSIPAEGRADDPSGITADFVECKKELMGQPLQDVEKWLFDQGLDIAPDGDAETAEVVKPEEEEEEEEVLVVRRVEAPLPLPKAPPRPPVNPPKPQLSSSPSKFKPELKAEAPVIDLRNDDWSPPRRFASPRTPTPPPRLDAGFTPLMSVPVWGRKPGPEPIPRGVSHSSSDLTDPTSITREPFPPPSIIHGLPLLSLSEIYAIVPPILRIRIDNLHPRVNIQDIAELINTSQPLARYRNLVCHTRKRGEPISYAFADFLSYFPARDFIQSFRSPHSSPLAYVPGQELTAEETPSPRFVLSHLPPSLRNKNELASLLDRIFNGLHAFSFYAVIQRQTVAVVALNTWGTADKLEKYLRGSSYAREGLKWVMLESLETVHIQEERRRSMDWGGNKREREEEERGGEKRRRDEEMMSTDPRVRSVWCES